MDTWAVFDADGAMVSPDDYVTYEAAYAAYLRLCESASDAAAAGLTVRGYRHMA